MWVKICGITNADQAVAIAQLGATALGFICVKRSPRFVSPETLATIAQTLKHQMPTPIETVGIFADANLEIIQATVAQGRLQTVQLHGQETPEFCRQVRAAIPDIRIIKALRIRSAADIRHTTDYEPVADALLLDAYHPQLLGGTGTTLDWSALLTFRPRRPWILAGGLNPDNVAIALGQLSPDGIDLSSGVEVSPGQKDMAKVKALFAALRTLRPSA